MKVMCMRDGHLTYETFPAVGRGRSAVGIKRSSHAFYEFFGHSRGQTPTRLCTARGPMEKQGRIEISVTTGRSATPLQLRLGAVHVAADGLPIGRAPATPHRVPWLGITVFAAVIGCSAWILRALK